MNTKRWSCALALAALAVAPLMMAADEQAPTGLLMNAACPLSSKPTTAKMYAAYDDDKDHVHARIYFCCDKCKASASGMDAAKLKELYTKSYLKKADGTMAEYGKARVELKNDKCPVTGEPVKDATINYNGVTVALCCAGCDKKVVQDPDKYLHSVQAAVDALAQPVKK